MRSLTATGELLPFRNAKARRAGRRAMMLTRVTSPQRPRRREVRAEAARSPPISTREVMT